MVWHWRRDGRTTSGSNFHIRLSASEPRGMNVRMAILQHAISISAMRVSGPWEADVRTVEVESAISILVACTSGPRLTDVRTVIFELWFLPYVWESPDGKPHRPDGVSIFSYSELGKNLKLIDHWWTSGRAAERSGRMQVGTKAFQYSRGSGRKDTSSGRMMLVCLASGWGEHVVRTDGTVDRWTSRQDDTSSGRLTGNLKSFIFFAVQSLLKMFWQVESLFTASLHISDFVQAHNEAKKTNRLPLWPFWYKNHLTGLEIHSRSKNKNYSPFLSQKGQRVKQSNKNQLY
jgi:hypothetical protein